jgi:hypothetical protein
MGEAVTKLDRAVVDRVVKSHVADEVLVGLADSLGVGVVPRPGREGPGRPLSTSPTGAVPRNRTRIRSDSLAPSPTTYPRLRRARLGIGQLIPITVRKSPLTKAPSWREMWSRDRLSGGALSRRLIMIQAICYRPSPRERLRGDRGRPPLRLLGSAPQDVQPAARSPTRTGGQGRLCGRPVVPTGSRPGSRRRAHPHRPGPRSPVAETVRAGR